MKINKSASLKKIFAVVILSSIGLFNNVFAQDKKEKEIYLIVRADDMGATHDFNLACIESYKEGVAKTVEVIVPGPWFLESVKLIKENPGLDVGVHLCLTSEWENCKWRPLTYAPSLVDENGYFFPCTSQRKDFPPNTGFLEAKPKLEEIENELRAQIKLALKHLPNTSHLSAHMGAATCMPELRAITEKLSKEFNLPIGISNVKPAGHFEGNLSPLEREAKLVTILEKLEPGFWHMVEHPAYDNPETSALSHIGYTNVGQDRLGVTTALTSQKVLEVIKKRNIKLISYSEAYKLMKK